MSIPIAILASGRGTNFQAIADAIQKGRLDARITAVLSDQSSAGVLDYARARGVQTWIASRSGLSREEQEDRILELLAQDPPRFLVLAGYMRILGKKVLAAFDSHQGYNRIVNIHPSLLPAFPGVDAYKQAFDFGCTWTGVTIHLVDDALDSGPICAQEGFSIENCKNPEDVQVLGLEVEHRLYPRTLSWVLREEFKLEIGMRDSSSGPRSETGSRRYRVRTC